ncbi:peptidyl-prolyl cis-trans isomerase [Ruegeria sp.]|uniref:peptidylprolyl isomerase n=1 Tax=Ruegeria sp. TaxID=1879320 RepID=UPI003AFFD4AB
MRLLKEPLFHFFLIGAAIFIWFHIISPESEAAVDLERIEITEQDVTLLSDQFEARWKRPPNTAELQALVDASIREEVLVREAKKLGLDRGDTVIRSRLSQKMGFLTEAIAASVVPEDEVLEAFRQQNLDQYATPHKIAFTQVFLGENPADGEVEQALDALRAQQEPADLSRSTLLPASMPLSATRVVDSVYGNGFSDGLTHFAKGEWAGPVLSGYGVHLVKVLEIEPSQNPPLEEIREVVLRDWLRATSEDLAQAQYETLAQGYEIIVPNVAELSE